MSTTSTMRRKLRQRRETRQFYDVLRTASPAMQQELIALASHNTNR